MKLVHFCPTNNDASWGDNTGSPNMLNHNDNIFRSFLTCTNTIDASGNILDPSNIGENHYNNGSTSAPVRLVAKEGDNTFLDPSQIFSGWILSTFFIEDPSVNNFLKPLDSKVLYLKLNENVKNPGTADEYFEISLGGLTKPTDSQNPTIVKMNGLRMFSIRNDYDINVGVMCFSKNSGSFELPISNTYGIIAAGGGDREYGDDRIQAGFALSSKDLTKNAGFKFINVDDGITKIINSIEVAFNGVLDEDFIRLDINKSGIRLEYLFNNSNSYSDIYYGTELSSLDPNDIVYVPIAFTPRASISSPNYFKQIEFNV